MFSYIICVTKNVESSTQRKSTVQNVKKKKSNDPRRGVPHSSAQCSQTMKATGNYLQGGSTHSVCAYVSMVTEMENQSQTRQIVVLLRVKAGKITKNTHEIEKDCEGLLIMHCTTMNVRLTAVSRSI